MGHEPGSSGRLQRWHWGLSGGIRLQTAPGCSFELAGCSFDLRELGESMRELGESMRELGESMRELGESEFRVADNI
jgi:hypothetical protein